MMQKMKDLVLTPDGKVIQFTFKELEETEKIDKLTKIVI